MIERVFTAFRWLDHLRKTARRRRNPSHAARLPFPVRCDRPRRLDADLWAGCRGPAAGDARKNSPVCPSQTDAGSHVRSREETEQPTLAVLQVDPPNADPAEQEDQAAAQNPPSATAGYRIITTIAAIPAPDASSNGTPAPSPAPSNSISTTAAGMAASANANTAELSEPPPSVVASVDADNVAKPDITETAVIQTDVIKSDVGVSDVAETMTSPLQSNFAPPLPVSRPAQVANVSHRPRNIPPWIGHHLFAKRNRHRKVIPAITSFAISCSQPCPTANFAVRLSLFRRVQVAIGGPSCESPSDMSRGRALDRARRGDPAPASAPPATRRSRRS